MSIFGARKSDAESDIDSFLSQKIILPQTFMQVNEGEHHIRIYGDSKYAQIRQELLTISSLAGQGFWQGKIFLKCRHSIDDRVVPSLLFDVLFDGKIIGQITEFDSVARSVLNFEVDQKYVARAVIRADLIGNLIHLFVNPDNAI